MNSAPEDFGQVRRLLALKRHEQPPPGYFNELPRRVIARLEAVRSSDSVSWIERVMRVFELRPVLASSCGVAAFGLLLFRLVAMQQFEETPFAMGGVENVSKAMIPAANGGMALNQFPNGDILQSSVNPAMNTQPPSSLFDGFHLNVQQVSFTGGN